MIKYAEFSECKKYRYLLVRGWDETRKPVVCIGLNPSTANAEDDDTTITNTCKLLDTMGYGGLYMMNLYGIISSKPEVLRSHPNPVGDNDRWIRDITKGQDIIFCWGSFKQAEYRAKKLIKEFPNAMCFGKTPKGHPLHPLAATIWQKSKCKLQPFLTGSELEAKHKEG